MEYVLLVVSYSSAPWLIINLRLTSSELTGLSLKKAARQSDVISAATDLMSL